MDQDIAHTIQKNLLIKIKVTSFRICVTRNLICN